MTLALDGLETNVISRVRMNRRKIQKKTFRLGVSRSEVTTGACMDEDADEDAGPKMLSKKEKEKLKKEREKVLCDNS